jgi:hypothetical protein
MGIIYKATSPSGNVYVGQTIRTLEERKSAHYSIAFNPKSDSYNSKFSYAIRKYSIESFIWQILADNIFTENLDLLERKYIEEENSNAKLNWDQVNSIREKFKTGNYTVNHP